jgi:hypothetical protein
VRGYIASPVAEGNTGQRATAARRDIYLPCITVFLKEASGSQIISNTVQRPEPLAAMDASGQRVQTARPGSTVSLSARGSDAYADRLIYKWLASSGKLNANESSEVSWELPKEPGRYSVSVLVYDGRGGYNKSFLSLRS